MWAGAKILAGMGIGALQSTLPVYSQFNPPYESLEGILKDQLQSGLPSTFEVQ